ncbi:MAG: AEC family transporter [Verrucomicrobiota bacterium]
MTDYLKLLSLIAPVFLVIACGSGMRAAKWIRPEADASLMNLLLKLCYPCLVFKSVLGVEAVKSFDNIVGPPIFGCLAVLSGFGIGLLAAKALGYKKGAGLRTFCFSIGICNYGYIPLPLIQGIYGSDTLAVLFVHNTGVEFAIWTIGVALLSGASAKEGLKKSVNPCSLALVLALGMNATGFDGYVPEIVMSVFSTLAAVSIPLGLVMIGTGIWDNLETKEPLWKFRSSIGSVVIRLGVLPMILLMAAKWIPLSQELKEVVVIQAAMPAGVMPILIAKHYGGQPIVAVRIVIATTVVSLFLIPFWISFGESWLGLR